MHRFFVSPSTIRGQQVRFAPDQAHQIRSVLRLRSGEEVEVLDGEGGRYRAALQHSGKSEVCGQIVQNLPAGEEPGGDLILCQAIARGERFDWVLQKGVELGVTHFQPIITRRTVRRSPGDGQRQRWQRIIREAAEQSLRGRLPQLLPEISFQQALAQRRGLSLMPATSATRPIRQALAAATWPLTLFIGPEGGFDPAEIEAAAGAGVELVGLGPRVLRTETAAVVLLALVAAQLGEMDRPAPYWQTRQVTSPADPASKEKTGIDHKVAPLAIQP
jgi:16S rRNA (uracil1498-N3)-methyltransferase